MMAQAAGQSWGQEEWTTRYIDNHYIDADSLRVRQKFLTTGVTEDTGRNLNSLRAQKISYATTAKRLRFFRCRGAEILFHGNFKIHHLVAARVAHPRHIKVRSRQWR